MHNEERWLSILELRGLLRLSPKACRNWVKRHIPVEAIQRQGRSLRIASWGINAALSECVWRPDFHQRRGFQGHPGQVAPNVHCRDDLGRFVSPRPGQPPPSKAKRVFVHPKRRRYLSESEER